jgi:RNA polymerase sporulation-specific sigma factor
MFSNKVDICGINTSKLKVLSSAEKERLLIQAKNGDTEARSRLIDGNLKLVLSVIQRFNNRGENLDDLFQVGCIGLIKAVDNFDITIGVKFSTYAVPMIIGEIRRYLRDNNAIRVSRSMRDLAYKALQVKEALSKTMSREPTIDDIVKVFDVPKEDIVNALDAIVDPISLFDPVYSDGGDSIYVMDQVSDEKSSDEIWLEDIALRDAMRRLNSREKKILMMRFFDGKTQTEVSEEIGISQAQVSRLEKNALSQMKKYFV